MCPATLQWELRQYLNQEVNISQEEQSQAKGAVETIKKAFQSFQHQSPYNFRQMFHQGSSYEGLKVIAADEFDLAVPFHLNDGGWSITSPPERGLSGYHRIERQSAEATWSSLTEYGSLSPAKVRQNMQSIVQQAVNGMSVGMRINLSYSGPAITLNVEYNNSSRMSIDVVPCLVLNGRKFVAKSPRNAGNDMYEHLWRESFSEEEKDKFNNIDRGNECRRDCLKILKTIQKKRGQSQLGMLSSYHLKTCMLHLNDQPGLSWHHDALADRFKNLLQKLMYYLERRNMPNYFQRSVNLFDWYDADSLKNILGWLRTATRSDDHIINDLLHQRGFVMPTPDNFEIFVKNQSGRTTTYQNMRKSTTVAQLKHEIAIREGIPADQQRLTCEGKQLEDGKTLGYYNIQQHSTIYLFGRLRGGDKLV